ncbi:MAG: TraX family protein [Velocimicrobium sp.]
MNKENGESNAIGKRGLSGSTLKLIAIVTMLIDHTAAVILEPLLHYQNGVIIKDNLYLADQIMRATGRIAFPIFCFLLVEGFFYTKSRVKYAIRLTVFAIISEVPFDLAFTKQAFYMSYQNVFFTLLIGLLMMMGIQYGRDHILPRITKGRNICALLMQTVIFLLAAVLADVLRTDYGFWGIIAIFVMYILRFNRLYMCLCEALYFMSFEAPTVVLSFLPIFFYNGKRGLNLKYIFYVFYPAHLLILSGIYMLYFIK